VWCSCFRAVGILKKYLSLVKFSHTIFALPFALIGFTFAVTRPNTSFDYKLLLLVLLCMVFARNAAMGFNRWADAKIDGKNPRTAVREIPAGKISSTSALLFVALNCLAFIACTVFINPLCLLLSVPFLAVILGYSYTKRFTSLSHFVLGFGLALAPYGAYLTVRPEWNTTMFFVSLLVFTWVSGFDIIYACQDEQFDKDNQLFSIPSYLGIKRALLVSTITHVFTALLVVVLGLYQQFGFMYWIGAVLFILLLVYQHYLVKPTDLSKVNLAFFTTNGLGSVVFALCFIVEILT